MHRGPRLGPTHTLPMMRCTEASTIAICEGLAPVKIGIFGERHVAIGLLAFVKSSSNPSFLTGSLVSRWASARYSLILSSNLRLTSSGMPGWAASMSSSSLAASAVEVRGMFLAWKKAQVSEAAMLVSIASLALPPPTLQIASRTASTPM